MFNKNRGFSSVVLIVIVVLVLGSGYWLWKNKVEGVEGWKTYQNEEYGFEFKYPTFLILDDKTDEVVALIADNHSDEKPRFVYLSSKCPDGNPGDQGLIFNNHGVSISGNEASWALIYDKNDTCLFYAKTGGLGGDFSQILATFKFIK